jgi:hypothetical protein
MNISIIQRVLNNFIDTKVNNFCSVNPMINLFKPVIKRAIDINVNKLYSKLSVITDSSGNIDVEGIIPEMIENIKNMEPYTINTESIGDIVIGKGSIILNIPMTDRRLVIDSTDLEELKTLLNSN